MFDDFDALPVGDVAAIADDYGSDLSADKFAAGEDDWSADYFHV